MTDYHGFRDVSGKERQRLARSGAALPDGSFPIASVQDLKNAIRAIGRAKNPGAAKAHIKRRARALGREDLIPEEWTMHSDMAQNYSQEDYSQNIFGVEIFRTGKWNGDQYDATDLEEIVSNFEKVGYQVPLKLGHSDNSGEPAYGWVNSVRLDGDRILADFRDVPDEVFQAIKDTRYDAVSSEVFWDLERNDQTFRRALKAVALLGAETPGVAGLKPLRESLRGFSEADLAKVHTSTFTKENEMSKVIEHSADEADTAELKALSEAQAAKIAELEAKVAKNEGDSGAEVKKLTEEVKALRAEAEAAKQIARNAEIAQKVDGCRVPAVREHLRALYSVAYASPKVVTFTFKDTDGKEKTDDVPAIKVVDELVELFNTNPQLAKLFSDTARNEIRREADSAEESPSAEVHRLTQLEMAKSKATYTDALKAVLADPHNAELKRAYALGR